MPIGRAGENASARRALHKALLHQIGFDDFLDRVAGFAQRRRDGLDPHRPTAESLSDQSQIAAAENTPAAATPLPPPPGGVGAARVPPAARLRRGGMTAPPPQKTSTPPRARE